MVRRAHTRTVHAACAVGVRLLRVRTRHALQAVDTHVRVSDQHARVTVIRTAVRRRSQPTKRIMRMRSRWAAHTRRAVDTVQPVGAQSARRSRAVHLAACFACAACAAVLAVPVQPEVRASCACARAVANSRLATSSARQALLAVRTERPNTRLALCLQIVGLLASVATDAHAAVRAVPTSGARLAVVSIGVRLLTWRACLARRHGAKLRVLDVVTMRAIQALDAVRRANTELHSVRLLSRRTEAARHAIRAVPTRRTHVALRVRRVRRTSRHTLHALEARGARPAVAHLVELVRIVAPQALRQGRRRCRARDTQVAHTVHTSVACWAHVAGRVQHVRLLAIRARRAHNAVRRVLADRHAVNHLVHTHLASTAGASSADGAWLAAGVIACRPSAVSTHLAVHQIGCETTVRVARPVHVVGTRITRDASRTEVTHRAQITRREGGARSSTSVAVLACTADTSLAGAAQHTGSRLARVVHLLAISTGAAGAITARRPNVAPLAARTICVRLSARRTNLTLASGASIPHTAVLARESIRRGLGPSSTLAAHSARASPSRRTWLARSHVFVRLSAAGARGASAVRSGETSTTAHAHRRAAVRLRARRTRRAHTTRAGVSLRARLALRAVRTRLLTRAATRTRTACAGLASGTAHARRPGQVRCVAVTAYRARPI